MKQLEDRARISKVRIVMKGCALSERDTLVYGGGHMGEVTSSHKLCFPCVRIDGARYILLRKLFMVDHSACRDWNRHDCVGCENVSNAACAYKRTRFSALT